MRHTRALVVLALVVPALIYAASVTIPHTFQDNTIASADQVNANFTAVKTAVDDNASRVAALEAGVAAPSVITLTDAPTIAVDASLGSIFQVTLGGNRTIANPTNLVNGKTYTFKLVQDATGGRTVSWGSAYQLSALSSLNTLANGVSVATFFSDGTNLYNTAAYPSGCAHGKQVFTHNGASQTFVMPFGCSALTVKLWGAGGGGNQPPLGSYAGAVGGVGGAGGYSTDTIAVPGGSTVTVIVGGGGAAGVYNGAAAGGFGGGGSSVTGSTSGAGGGGGRSEVSVGATRLIAGGGGGAGWSNSSSAPGGAGGGASGTTGLGTAAARGGPGSTTGGSAGTGSSGNGSVGTANNGGTGSWWGGGGGGGYFGGGGGGSPGDGVNGGGGGGSGLVTATGTSTAGSGQTPPNTSDSDYQAAGASFGGGGSKTGPGQHGLVVLSW